MTTELFHTVLELDVSEDDLYTRHQKIAAFLSRDASAARDFLFAVMRDQVYLRAPQPRVNEQGWKPMALPQEGRTYLVTGTTWIDAARLPAAQREVWRTPHVLDRIVTRMLSRLGDVELREVNLQPVAPLTKPGQPVLRINPVAFAANVTIRDGQAAADIARNGIGRGKGFGFGCVFFAESDHA